MMSINRYHRPRIYAGGWLIGGWVGGFQPVPPDLLMYLPPVPPGYAIAYYDGYVVVYDPNTLYVLSVIDLFNY